MKKINWKSVSKVVNTDLLDKTNITKFLNQQIIDELSDALQERGLKTSDVIYNRDFKIYLQYNIPFINSAMGTFVKSKLTLSARDITITSFNEAMRRRKNRFVNIEEENGSLTINDNFDGTYNFRKNGKTKAKLLDKNENAKLNLKLKEGQSETSQTSQAQSTFGE